MLVLIGDMSSIIKKLAPIYSNLPIIKFDELNVILYELFEDKYGDIISTA